MKNKYFFTLLLILFTIFWVWWLPGLRVANDFSFVSSDWLRLQFDIPRAWNERGAEGMGEYGVFTLWSYPVNLFFGILTNLGLNFQIWERILVILYIFLGSFSIWKFLSQYTLSNKSKFIGSLFYLINTYPILLIDGGQLSIALAYALFPLAFLQTYKAVYLSVRKKILAGILISVLGAFDIRFLFILFLLLLIKALFDIWEHRNTGFGKVCRQWISLGGIVIVLVGLLNAYWLMLYLKVPINGVIFASLTNLSTSLFNIGHPILTISPHWFKNVFGQISKLEAEFIVLPVLVFFAPILRRKDKTVFFWMFIAIFSIFLAKGGSEPFSFVYPWLHSNIPSFSFFRDSTKFYFLITLSYAVLLSISSEEILKISKKFKVLYLFIITVYLVYLIRPVFLNQMTGTFSIQPAEGKFQSLTNVMRNDNQFGRVFWIPATAPLSYSDLNHPIVEALRVFNKVPFAYGVKGTYEAFNFLREASYMGEIFDVSAISYIAYPYSDTRRDRLSQDDIKYYYNFLNQLTNFPWIDKKIPESTVPLLKTKNSQDKIFITGNTWIVFGADEVFKESTKSAGLKLANNAVIFAEEKPEMGPLINKYPEAKIVLNKKTDIDLLASFIPESQIIFPSKQLAVAPDFSGWWKNAGTDLVHWNDFLQTKYGIINKDFDLGGGWAVGEGNLSLKIQSDILKKDLVLLARVMESSQSGSLSFYQENSLIGSINTISYEGTVKWFEVGLLQKTADLTIKTNGKINVVNALALVDKKDLSLYKYRANNLLKNVKDFKAENLEDSIAKIHYIKINQTKYRVEVTGLSRPQVIVFSATYHPGWELNGQSPIPVYGFLNGFRVDKDGEYILEFNPQKYINVGLVVSIFGCIAILSYLFIRKGKKRT